MSLRFLLQQRIPRFFVRRHFATSMKEYESLYDVLEVEPGATKTEIREAWLRLTMKYHPDLNKDSEEANEKFIRIKDAYKILNNEESRSKYNDSIGFKHHDPPPDFHHHWTEEGEINSYKATEYWRWDEQRIKDLMSGERLREVNWRDMAPSERYRVLIEEENKRKEEAQTETDDKTPPTSILLMRLSLVLFAVSALTLFSYRVEIIENSEEIKELHKRNEKKSHNIQVGNALVFRQTLTPMQEHYGYFQKIDMDKIREERRRAADIQETS